MLFLTLCTVPIYFNPQICLKPILRILKKKLEHADWLPVEKKANGKISAQKLENIEKEHIKEALKTTGWRVSGEKGAAKILGLNPTTLEARMKKLGIKRE